MDSRQRAGHITRADARNPQQRPPAGLVQLQRRGAQMQIGPGLLRIHIQAQILFCAEAEVFHPPAVISQQKTGLIEPMRSLQGGGRQVLEGRVVHWMESGVVDPAQPGLTLQRFAQREQFQIRIAHRADDKLGNG